MILLRATGRYFKVHYVPTGSAVALTMDTLTAFVDSTIITADQTVTL